MNIKKAEAVRNRRNEGCPTPHKDSKRALTTQFWDLPQTAVLVLSECPLWRNYVNPRVRKR
jgi:hypothetical protein